MSNDKKNTTTPNTEGLTRTIPDTGTSIANEDYREKSENNRRGLDVVNTLPPPPPMPKRDNSNGNS
jgi:hypothetical protein